MRLQRTLFSVYSGFNSVEPPGYASLWMKHQFFGNFLFIHSAECYGPQGWELTAFLLLHSPLSGVSPPTHPNAPVFPLC